MPVSDESIVEIIGGFLFAMFTGLISWLNLKINRIEDKAISRAEFKQYMDSQEKLAEAHRAEFKQYMEGQERLTEAHVENTRANTAAIIKLNERIDKL